MLTDEQLIEKLKTSEGSTSLLELYSKHHKLMFSTAQKYCAPGSQEFLDVETYFLSIIYDSAIKYDSEKGSKFSTWLANQVRYFCLNSFSEKARKEQSVEPDYLKYLLSLRPAEVYDSKVNIIKNVKDLLSQINDEKIKNVISIRYFSSDKIVSYNEIADKLNITAQTALNWHNKFIHFIQKNIDKVYN